VFGGGVGICTGNGKEEVFLSEIKLSMDPGIGAVKGELKGNLFKTL